MKNQKQCKKLIAWAALFLTIFNTIAPAVPVLAQDLDAAAPIATTVEQINDSADKTIKVEPAPTPAVAINLDAHANTWHHTNN